MQIDATGQLEDFEDDEDGDDTDESIILLTPLALALMFRNLVATKALLKHGAKFDKINNTAGWYSFPAINASWVV